MADGRACADGCSPAYSASTTACERTGSFIRAAASQKHPASVKGMGQWLRPNVLAARERTARRGEHAEEGGPIGRDPVVPNQVQRGFIMAHSGMGVAGLLLL